MDKEEQRNAKKALKLLQKLLPLRNDFDAYILAVVDFGLSEDPEPIPGNYGLKHGIQGR